MNATQTDWREEISTPGKYSKTLKTGIHAGSNVWILPDGEKLARYPQQGYFTPGQAMAYVEKHKADLNSRAK